MAWVESLTLTGSPTISGADDPPRSASSGPWVRLTFDESGNDTLGRISSTQTARQLTLLVVADVFWPAPQHVAPGSDNLYGAQTIADELRDALQYQELTFLDYTIPASPAAVAGVTIKIPRVDPIRRLADDAGFRRRQIRGFAQWIARSDDYNA